jgi:hypothetical protein
MRCGASGQAYIYLYKLMIYKDKLLLFLLFFIHIMGFCPCCGPYPINLHCKKLAHELL